MGRGGKRGRTQRRDFRNGREDVWKKTKQEDGWAPFVLESPAFEAYYKAQKIMHDEEWDAFLSSMRKQLPTTFRINGSGQFAMNIRDQMQREFFEYLKDEKEIDGEKIEPARPLPWYPDNLAWHLSFSRSQLRKIPVLQRIHEFLKEENELGSITRQEAVSMVPPLFLNVHPEHRVLDMCAAPGSKTFQFLEIIHSKDEAGVLPKGTVVANDSDIQRCNLLIHQTKRMSSPNIIVTNHEAQHFPGLKQKDIKETSDAHCGDEARLLFDRILCDVPCSGDGTIRKAPDLWKKWNPGTGNGLHRLQVQIAMRGVSLLKVGGLMVYSTCSLNPVEDEAVVAEILRASEGSMELLDVSAELPELKRRPGLTSWKVQGKKRWYASYASYNGSNKYRAGFVLPSMFPSGNRGASLGDPSDENEDGEVTALPLHRCMRILPHDQDTGGFFIAVLKKVRPYTCVPKSGWSKDKKPKSDLQGGDEDADESVKQDRDDISEHSAEDNVEHATVEQAAEDNGEQAIEDNLEQAAEENTEKAAEDSVEQNVEEVMKETEEGSETLEASELLENAEQKPRGKLQSQGPWYGVDPVLVLMDETIIDSLISYYGISEAFPLRGHLIVRNEDTSRVKRIYFVSKSVAAIFQLNDGANQVLKITSAGLKIFERHSNKETAMSCHFRIASEGLPLLLPHMSRQKLYATKDDFKLLLSPNAIPFTAFQDESFTAEVQKLLVGCCVVVLKDTNNDAGVPTAIGCWRGRTNMSLLVPRIEADQMLKRLFPPN